VNHGPYLVDNNLFLSELSLREWSEGGAYVHNLFVGKIEIRKVLGRFTPYHFAHSTRVAGLRNIFLGDNRFFNNIFVKQDNGDEEIKEDWAQFYGLHGYQIAGFENISCGNVYFNGAKPGSKEMNFLEKPGSKPFYEIEEKEGNVFLKMQLDLAQEEVNTTLITSRELGATVVSEAIFEHPDGSPYAIDLDFLGHKRNGLKPLPGPFEKIEKGTGIYKVW